MKKISKYLKIFMVLAIAVAMVQISPVRAAEDITLNENEHIEITFTWGPTMNNAPVIGPELFDTSTTDWIYVYDNSDMRSFGIIDENFEGIEMMSDSDRLLCSPVNGSATFYGSQLIEEVQAVHNTYGPAAVYCELRFFDEYTINNNEEWDIFLFTEDDFLVDYTTISSDGLPIGSETEVILPERLATGESITIKAAGDYNDINNPVVGGFYYTIGNNNNITSYAQVASEYSTVKENVYDMDGTAYTVTNNANYEIDITSIATAEFQAAIYDSKGASVGTITNVQAIGRECTGSIPAGGKMVYSYSETSETNTLNISYYEIFDSLIKISGVRKPLPTENKNVYIHFPEGPLVPNGLNKDSNGYYLSTKVTYVETTLEQQADTVGGFTIPSVKDTTGMAVVNKWYVYNSKTGTYFSTPVVTGDTLTVEPFKAGLYSQLLSIYSYSSEYHLYAEWEIPAIAKSGTYKLIEDVGYSFGSGRWQVANDVSVYSGGMAFYIDKDAGSYQLTLQ